MLEEFKGKFIEKNGKKVFVVKAKSKTITKPDGNKDVIIEVPSLSLINNFLENNKEEKK